MKFVESFVVDNVPKAEGLASLMASWRTPAVMQINITLEVKRVWWLLLSLMRRSGPSQGLYRLSRETQAELEQTIGTEMSSIESVKCWVSCCFFTYCIVVPWLGLIFFCLNCDHNMLFTILFLPPWILLVVIINNQRCSCMYVFQTVLFWRSVVYAHQMDIMTMLMIRTRVLCDVYRYQYVQSAI